MRTKASSILLSSLRPRSRIRSKKARSDSSEARSEGSEQASWDLALSVPSARSASSRISLLRSSSRRRKKFRSLCLIITGREKCAQILLAPYCHVNSPRNKLEFRPVGSLYRKYEISLSRRVFRAQRRHDRRCDA